MPQAFPKPANDTARYENQRGKYEPPAWLKDLFCQRVAEEGGAIWNWWKNGNIDREGVVLFTEHFSYDPLHFLDLAKEYGETIGDRNTLAAFLSARQTQRDANQIAHSNKRKDKPENRPPNWVVDAVLWVGDGLSAHYGEQVRVMAVDEATLIPKYLVRQTKSPYSIFKVDQYALSDQIALQSAGV